MRLNQQHRSPNSASMIEAMIASADSLLIMPLSLCLCLIFESQCCDYLEEEEFSSAQAFLTQLCPAELELLLLGGSSVDIPLRASQPDSEAGSSRGFSQQPTEPRTQQGTECQGSYQSRLASALVDAVQLLSNLQTLELTFFPASTVTAVALEITTIQVSCFEIQASVYSVMHVPQND